MLNITNTEMQIRTTMRYLLIPLDRIATIRNPRKTSVCKNMEKSEHLCIVGCDIKWYSCCQKQYGIFLKKLNTEFPFLKIIDDECVTCKHCLLTFTIHCDGWYRSSFRRCVYISNHKTRLFI